MNKYEKYAMISQPMHGLSDEHIKAVRDKAAEDLKSDGYNVINTYFSPDTPHTEVKHDDIFWLAESILRMSKCDAVYFCADWQKYRGCRIEHEIAEQYGLKIMYQESMPAEA